MPNYTTSPNMSLQLPTTGVAPGPDWADELNASLSIIDQHDHSSGNGVPITPSGLSITSDLSIGSNNLTAVKTTRYTSQSAALSGGSDLSCAYAVLGDLYFNDGSGNQVRITQSGAVAGTPGSIANLVSPASASYVSSAPAFVFQSAALTPANIDGGSLTIRKIVASSNGITLSAPNALASNYTLTLPVSLPASQKFATIDNSGNVAAPWAVDNSTLEISSNTLQVKDLGVTAAKIAAATITTSQISATAGILGSQLVTNISLAGTLLATTITASTKMVPTSTFAEIVGTTTRTLTIQKAGTSTKYPIVTGYPGAAQGLVVLQAVCSNGGTIAAGGEGLGVSHPSTGRYTITFTTAFAVTPVVLVNNQVTVDQDVTAHVLNLTTSGCDIRTDLSGGPADCAFNFIVVGMRND